MELDTIWAGVLMIELESLMEAGGADHCSDISAISSGGYEGGLAHGHNEDWSAEVRALGILDAFLFGLILKPQQIHAIFISINNNSNIHLFFFQFHFILYRSAEVRELYYYVKYTAAPGADFASCAGLAYPGALIGWAPTWNARGIFMTVNTLFPRCRESIKVRESTRVVLGDIPKGVVWCSLDSRLLLSPFFASSPPLNYPP